MILANLIVFSVQVHWFSMAQPLQTMVLSFWKVLVNMMLSHFSALQI